MTSDSPSSGPASAALAPSILAPALAAFALAVSIFSFPVAIFVVAVSIFSFPVSMFALPGSIFMSSVSMFLFVPAWSRLKSPSFLVATKSGNCVETFLTPLSSPGEAAFLFLHRAQAGTMP